MNWTIDPSTLPDFLTVRTNGSPSAETFAEMWNDICRHADWRPGNKVFFDNRELEQIEMGQNMTDAAAKFFLSKEQEIGAARIAILSRWAQNIQYGRQFRYALSHGRSSVSLHMFLDEQEALTWLLHSSNHNLPSGSLRGRPGD